ncbi:MAG TPA: glycoside hydrolase family 15 protein [Nitrospira sp.]|nr:glycoside hydrolase family 15 protein [Nitrospira sp.]
MLTPISDYALLGDLETAALVSRRGSIDWLCTPAFGSGACFAALMGTARHGRWLLAPTEPVQRITRRYRPETLVLETDYESHSGAVTITDFMPRRSRHPMVLRLVQGTRGEVPMHMECIARFDYGSVLPWIRLRDGAALIAAGPDALRLQTDVPLRKADGILSGDFVVRAGDRRSFALTAYPSHESPPPNIDVDAALDETEAWWRQWTARCAYRGPWRDAVVRSLIILKALTCQPTGGVLAAATTSLSESLRGSLNWDYRFCWLRDASLTMRAFLESGYESEARAWREWVLRAVAGAPSDLQVVYGADGTRRLPEHTLDWLPGYGGIGPVHVGNAAVQQCQLDVYGEVISALSSMLERGIEPEAAAWDLQRSVLDYLESEWERTDHGIWESREEPTQHTYSKLMAWVAADRAIGEVEHLGLPGPTDTWRRLRADIHDAVCRQGYDRERGCFVRSFGSKDLDASLLRMPLIGFLPPDDPRVQGTVAAIERELMVHDGLLYRYSRDGNPQEGVFLACSFWLVEARALMKRHKEAARLFERLLGVANDVGLLAEEYDPGRQRLLGNFPVALSHLSLINAAHTLQGHCVSGNGEAEWEERGDHQGSRQKSKR